MAALVRSELCNLLPQASAKPSSSAKLVDATRSSRSYSPTSQEEEEEHQPIVENATERSDAVGREARAGRCAWLRHGAHQSNKLSPVDSQLLSCQIQSSFALLTGSL